MTKIKTFDMPYIGIDTEKHGIIYNDCGDYSVVIQCQNPIEQYCADYNAYQMCHQLFENILKVLGSDYTLQKQDIFTKRTYSGKATKDFLSSSYFSHFKGRDYIEITTYLVITRNIRKSMFFNFDERQYEDFNDKIEKILALLTSAGTIPGILYEKQIKHYVKQMIAFNFRDEHYFLDNIKSSDTSISTHTGHIYISQL